ncbi:hypothetical protein [Pseudomonas cyclaminis]|uniref:hypothetical protein n=1 Tax=Pseudomonas cyclaminis TaxID=2781239 RepID=UPI003816DD65
MEEKKLLQKPLSYKNHEKPGAYKLASVLRESVLNPGALIEIDQFITGYGSSSGLKITCYPSNELFVENESLFESGLGPSKDRDDTIVWGGKIGNVRNDGISIAVPSMQTPEWPESHSIFDMNLNANFVMTERRTPKPPLSYRLRLKKDATPGPHYIIFI